jgi:hypothetical protein
MSQTSRTSYPTYGSLALKPTYHNQFDLVDCRPYAPKTRSGRDLRARQHAEARIRARSRAVFAVRLLLAGLALACALVVLAASTRLAGSLMPTDNADVTYTQANRVVVVHAGDTVWQIAASHPVQGWTTADLAHYIVQTNDLAQSGISCGMRLVVPA